MLRHRSQDAEEYWDISETDLSIGKFLEAIASVKTGKSVGADGITGELLMDGGRVMQLEFLRIWLWNAAFWSGSRRMEGKHHCPDNDVGYRFTVDTGVLQGVTLEPFLIIMVLDLVLSRPTDLRECGVTLRDQD